MTTNVGQDAVVVSRNADSNTKSTARRSSTTKTNIVVYEKEKEIEIDTTKSSASTSTSVTTANSHTSDSLSSSSSSGGGGGGGDYCSNNDRPDGFVLNTSSSSSLHGTTYDRNGYDTSSSSNDDDESVSSISLTHDDDDGELVEKKLADMQPSSPVVDSNDVDNCGNVSLTTEECESSAAVNEPSSLVIDTSSAVTSNTKHATTKDTTIAAVALDFALPPNHRATTTTTKEQSETTSVRSSSNSTVSTEKLRELSNILGVALFDGSLACSAAQRSTVHTLLQCSMDLPHDEIRSNIGHAIYTTCILEPFMEYLMLRAESRNVHCQYAMDEVHRAVQEIGRLDDSITSGSGATTTNLYVVLRAAYYIYETLQTIQTMEALNGGGGGALIHSTTPTSVDSSSEDANMYGLYSV